MTPREFEFMCFVIQESARDAYRRGHEEGVSGKPLNLQQYSMTRAHQMRLKTEMKKFVEKR